MSRFFILQILLAVLLWRAGEAVAFDWETGFRGIVDNREAKSSVQLPQTIIGGQGSALCGTTLDSLHQFRVGISYLQEFGAQESWKKVDLLLYYHYSSDVVNFYIGSFPRCGVLAYPEFLLSDSLGYFRSNIEGALYERAYSFGRQNVWLDWSSQKSGPQHEAFFTGFSGSMNWGGLSLSHYFLYYHYAHSGNHLPEEHIRDNGGAVVRVGYQKTEAGPIDSLSVSCDGLVSFDRVRNVTGWHTPVGLEAACNVFMRQFGVGISYYKELYADDGNVPHQLLFGDGRYSSREFFQGNLYYFPIRSANVSAEFILSFTLIEQGLDTRQLFLLNMLFGKSNINRER